MQKKRLDKLDIPTTVSTASSLQLSVPQTGQQITSIHILLNTSKSKENQTLKLVQLIQYSSKHISKKSCTKHGGQTSSTQILL